MPRPSIAPGSRTCTRRASRDRHQRHTRDNRALRAQQEEIPEGSAGPGLWYASRVSRDDALKESFEGGRSQWQVWAFGSCGAHSSPARPGHVKSHPRQLLRGHHTLRPAERRTLGHTWPLIDAIDDDVEQITGDSCTRSTMIADEPAQQEKPQRGSSPHCGYPGKN